MPTLTFTFDTGNVPVVRIIEALAVEYGYSPTLQDQNGNPTGPNPETKAQFARRMVGATIRGLVIASEKRAARDKAEAEVPPVTLT